MAEIAYALTQSDRELVARLLERERRASRNSEANGYETPSQYGQASQTYVVKVPVGGIPARVGNKPGVADCEIYTLEQEDLADPASDWVLTGVVDLDATLIKLHSVFNIYYIPIYPFVEEYVKVTKDGYGRWICERPYNTLFGIVTTAIPQGSTGGVVELVQDPTSWTLTGITLATKDYFMNTGMTLPVDTKLEITNVNGTWIWRVATCIATNTPPAAPFMAPLMAPRKRRVKRGRR